MILVEFIFIYEVQTKSIEYLDDVERIREWNSNGKANKSIIKWNNTMNLHLLISFLILKYLIGDQRDFDRRNVKFHHRLLKDGIFLGNQWRIQINFNKTKHRGREKSILLKCKSRLILSSRDSQPPGTHQRRIAL